MVLSFRSKILSEQRFYSVIIIDITNNLYINSILYYFTKVFININKMWNRPTFDQERIQNSAVGGGGAKML